MMFSGRPLLFVILLAITIRLLALFISIKNPHFAFQQDNYLNYILELRTGKLNIETNVDSRLFPGYPLLMLLISTLTTVPLFISGLLISFASSISSIILFNNMVKNKIATLLLSIFPSVWILSSIKISTEPLTVFLLLASLYLFLKKKIFLAGLILGYATGVRLIAICLFAALMVVGFKWYGREKLLPLISGFILVLSFFVCFNLLVFGDIFHQLVIYPKIGGASGSAIGIIQLAKDIPRTLDWHQYRIFFSGLFYILMFVASVIFLSKYKIKNSILGICFFWALFSLAFILLYGPSPLLEEFGRFSIPALPAIILGITTFFDNRKILITRK